MSSYERATKAWDSGVFKDEVVDCIIEGKKGNEVINRDEEVGKYNPGKMSGLRPAFKKDGSVTAANASKLNDGASSLILMGEDKMKSLGLKPLARILASNDSETAPVDFTIAPHFSISNLLKDVSMSVKDIDLFELNEAFSCVSLVNMQLLGLDASKVNISGGAVSMGHPIGNSGARIICTLLTNLKKENKS